MIGARAAAANRPPAFSTLVATAPIDRKIGLRSMIRVSSTVLSSCAGSNRGVMIGTIVAAPASTARRDRIASPISMRLMTVDTIRQARGCSSAANRADTTGINADDSAPGRHELEDQVRDAERGEERVKLGGRAEFIADDQQPDIAEHARDEEGAGHDEPRPCDGTERCHGVETRRARGWAPR